jgi:hypothetical protein
LRLWLPALLWVEATSCQISALFSHETRGSEHAHTGIAIILCPHPGRRRRSGRSAAARDRPVRASGYPHALARRASAPRRGYHGHSPIAAQGFLAPTRGRRASRNELGRVVHLPRCRRFPQGPDEIAQGTQEYGGQLATAMADLEDSKSGPRKGGVGSSPTFGSTHVISSMGLPRSGSRLRGLLAAGVRSPAASFPVALTQAERCPSYRESSRAGAGAPDDVRRRGPSNSIVDRLVRKRHS